MRLFTKCVELVFCEVRGSKLGRPDALSPPPLRSLRWAHNTRRYEHTLFGGPGPSGRGILRGVSALDLGGRRWTMSRLLRVGDKVINLDNIEFMTRDESGVVRIHFIHGDIELWNKQGEAFRQWVLPNAGYCRGSGGGW